MQSRPKYGKTSSLRSQALLCAIALTSLASAQAADSKLKGDPKAVALIERMIDRLGGTATWSNARSLHLEYRVWRTDPDEHLIERAWRDLREPNQRIELLSPSAPVTWTFTRTSGWVSRSAGITTLSEKRHASAVKDWPFDFYTIIRSLAVADQQLILKFVAPRRVAVTNTAGADWGWWEIDSTGAPLKWGVSFDDGPVEYVYGPVKEFDGLRFPAWGSAVDGSWRFEYAVVRLSPEPIPAALLAKPE